MSSHHVSLDEDISLKTISEKQKSGCQSTSALKNKNKVRELVDIGAIGSFTDNYYRSGNFQTVGG